MSAVLLARYRAILCDLDGCLVSGETVLPGAQAFVEGAGARLMVLSNNSTDTGASLSARLARGGLAVAPARIVLAGSPRSSGWRAGRRGRGCLSAGRARRWHTLPSAGCNQMKTLRNS